jgi:hypothetical protein
MESLNETERGERVIAPTTDLSIPLADALTPVKGVRS